MSITQNKSEQKSSVTLDAAKNQKIQAEKNKQKTVQKPDVKKDASGKSSSKSGKCC